MQRDNPQTNRYDYTQAGFDAFLSRSIDSMRSPTLGSGGQSRALAFDKQQVGGAIGDTIRLGRISLNGAGSITVDADDNSGTVFFYVGDDRS